MKLTSRLKKDKTFYLFIDESGNFDFSPQGTRYFSLTGFITDDPITKRENLGSLRYRVLSEGVDHEYFHATEDKQVVRDEVYSFLASLGDTYEVHSVIAQKNKTYPSLYKESYKKGGKLITLTTGIELYKKLCECLLKYVFTGKSWRAKKIIVVLSSLFVGDKKKVLLQTLKHFLKNEFSRVPFEIFLHQTCADLNCQLADYCCWAISVKYERREERPYEIIKKRIRNEFDYFQNGKHEYYQYKNP